MSENYVRVNIARIRPIVAEGRVMTVIITTLKYGELVQREPPRVMSFLRFLDGDGVDALI